jgi:hypothetical protein
MVSFLCAALLAAVALLPAGDAAFAQQPQRHILLEEFSTAPCGFCPDGDIVAAQVVRDHPQVIWVTHHAGFGTDSMTIPESKTIANAFTCFAPGAAIDRGDYRIPVYTYPLYIAVSRQKWDSVITAHYVDPAVARVNVTNYYDAASRTLRCRVDANFLTAPAPGDLRVNLYLVEDSVTGTGTGWDQKNYYNDETGHPCYGKGDPIVGYVHHRVVRAIPTGAWGVSGVIPQAPAAGSSYSWNSGALPLNVRWKPDDMEVVAFVSYHHDSARQRPVLNSTWRKMTDTTGTTAIESRVAALPAVAVYPSPVTDVIAVRSTGAGADLRFELFDALGRLVRSEEFAGGTTHTMPRGALPPGMYLYRVRGAGPLPLQGRIVLR